MAEGLLPRFPLLKAICSLGLFSRLPQALPPVPLLAPFSPPPLSPEGELRFVQRCTARLTPPAARGSTPPVALMAVAARQWCGPPLQGEVDDSGEEEAEEEEDSGDSEAEARRMGRADVGTAAHTPLLPAEELTRQLAAALMPDRASETRCVPSLPPVPLRVHHLGPCLYIWACIILTHASVPLSSSHPMPPSVSHLQGSGGRSALRVGSDGRPPSLAAGGGSGPPRPAEGTRARGAFAHPLCHR